MSRHQAPLYFLAHLCKAFLNMTLPVAPAENEWRKEQTAKDNVYRAGYPCDCPAGGTAKLHLLKLPPFKIDVNWPVGKEGVWVETTTEVKQTAGIKQYMLYHTFGKENYRLRFTNTAHYNYYFQDATADTYNVDCYLNGNHYVDYQSENPTILHIFSEGS
ncbi:unnamed protein product [Rhizoctonia solani]|uniref:Uncharacterized protein n=1 Tax=Rhizoctonia solani TaxID=456999 RepID=A0A8H3HBF9_9AGAM|nr:unnamed protein product [Rhizoctonia solani]